MNTYDGSLNGESFENGGEKDRELWSKLDKGSSRYVELPERTRFRTKVRKWLREARNGRVSNETDHEN